jgi:hypothetical protein
VRISASSIRFSDQLIAAIHKEKGVVTSAAASTGEIGGNLEAGIGELGRHSGLGNIEARTEQGEKQRIAEGKDGVIGTPVKARIAIDIKALGQPQIVPRVRRQIANPSGEKGIREINGDDQCSD